MPAWYERCRSRRLSDVQVRRASAAIAASAGRPLPPLFMTVPEVRQALGLSPKIEG